MNMRHFGSNLVIAALIGLASSAAWQQNIFFASEKKEAIELRFQAALGKLSMRESGAVSWDEMNAEAREIENRFSVRAADGKIGLWISGVLLVVGIAGVFGSSEDRRS